MRAAMRSESLRTVALVVALSFVYAAFGVLEQRRSGPGSRDWLDPDQIGDIGENLCRHGEFAEIPGRPTVLRGPAYPAALAAPCLVTGIDAARLAPWVNGLCHGFLLLTLALHPMMRPGWPHRLVLAAVGLDPLLLNYAGRTYLEPMFVLSVALVILGLDTLRRKPGTAPTLLLGAALGFSLLVKPVLFYFLPLVPLLMLPQRRAVLRGAAAVLLAIAVILPWTLRNREVTGRIIPVATGAWEIVLKGDTFARYAFEAPGIVTLEDLAKKRLADLNTALGIGDLPLQEREPRYREVALDEARGDPLGLLRKMAVQSIAFWFAGGDARNTLIFLALQAPLLALCLWSVTRWRTFPPADLVGVGSVSIYLLAVHSFSLAIARYSMPLRPWLVLLSGLALVSRLRADTAHA
jgi:hypothetical protein